MLKTIFEGQYVGVKMTDGEFIIGKLIKTFVCECNSEGVIKLSDYDKQSKSHLAIRKCSIPTYPNDKIKNTFVDIDINEIALIFEIKEDSIYSSDDVYITNMINRMVSLMPQNRSEVYAETETPSNIQPSDLIEALNNIANEIHSLNEKIGNNMEYV